MSKPNPTKKTAASREQRQRTATRVIFVIISVILILSWILTLVVVQ